MEEKIDSFILKYSKQCFADADKFLGVKTKTYFFVSARTLFVEFIAANSNN